MTEVRASLPGFSSGVSPTARPDPAPAGPAAPPAPAPEPPDTPAADIIEEHRAIAGPPPAFELSLLEIEADIDAILKRLEAAREKEANEQAIQPDATLPTFTSSRTKGADAP